MSSGFGPFFVLGIAVLLGLRRRWKALAVAVLPQGLAYVWWYVTWQSDPASDRTGGRAVDVPRFALRGLTATFDSLTSIPGVGLVALIASVAVIGTKRRMSGEQTLLIALWATVVAMLCGVGLHRVGFGISFAASSRYQYMVAMLCAPAFACAVDLLRRVPWSKTIAIGFAVLVLSGLSNANALRINAGHWADMAQEQKRDFELVAGSPLLAQANPASVPYVPSPDVHVASLRVLTVDGAITPRPPRNQGDVDRVAKLLGLPAPIFAPPTAGPTSSQYAWHRDTTPIHQWAAGKFPGSAWAAVTRFRPSAFER
jgi:hypothetical protein